MAPATLALLALASAMFWFARRERPAPSATGHPTATTPTPSPRPSPPPDSVELVSTPLADELHGAQGDEARDVAALRGLLGLLTTALRLDERPPLGDNADVAAALTGWNRRRIAFIAPGHPALRAGLLVDRHGQPYHFHARSAEVIDVRAAGPDGRLFTDDDFVSRLKDVK